jgi:hypothetical protein
MWEIYTGRNQGIAVRSSLEALSRAFPQAAADDPPSNILKARLVEYIVPDHQEPAPGRFDDDKEVTRKRRWYEYEKEMRTFYTEAKNWVEPSKAFEPGAYRMPGIWVRCCLKTLISGIVMAPKSLPYMTSAVREVLRRFGFEPELVSASPLDAGVRPPNPTQVEEEWARRFKTDA